MGTKEKNMRVKKFNFYFVMFIPLILFSNAVVDIFEREICGIIFMMNLIAIPCCVIYYKVTKKNNGILYSLFYFSLLIDNLYIYYMMTNFPKYSKVPLLLLLRVIIIALIVFDCKKIVRRILDNKVIVFTLFILINVVGILTNKFTVDLLYRNKIVDYSIGIILISLIISVVIILFNSHKKMEFMEIVFSWNVVLMGLRRVVFYYKLVLGKEVLIDDKIVSCFGFCILLVGLFVECSCLVKENNNLEREVKSISKDIKEYQEIDKLRIQFFANISHEIKTPVNIIFSGVQLIESNEDDEIMLRCFKKYLPSIKQNCLRILRLTDNLIDMTRLDSGFMEMNFKNADIVSLVEDIVMSVVEYADNKNIRIIFDTLIEEKIIKCDKDGIERIILNLISNSIKFTEANGKILVFIEMENDYVVIKVRDNGIGIAKEYRESVFNVFVQGDKSLNRKREGSGIGLSLVKAIVEKHDGKVNFTDIDEGTEVVIRLPDKVIEESEDSSKLNIECEKDIMLKIDTEFSDIY